MCLVPFLEMVATLFVFGVKIGKIETSGDSRCQTISGSAKGCRVSAKHYLINNIDELIKYYNEGWSEILNHENKSMNEKYISIKLLFLFYNFI
jgi:hypothetical protein